MIILTFDQILDELWAKGFNLEISSQHTSQIQRSRVFKNHKYVDCNEKDVKVKTEEDGGEEAVAAAVTGKEEVSP